MKANICGAERAVRIIAGLALIAWPLFANGPVWAWIGVVPLVTGLINYCPAYGLFGISTCKTKHE